MLFGVIYEGEDKKRYRMAFSSDVTAHHFRIGESVSKHEMMDIVDHVVSACKVARGNARTTHCCEKHHPPKKKVFQFILLRHLERKKALEEKVTNRIDMSFVDKKNEEALKEMLNSESKTFKVVQSHSLQSMDFYEEFYGLKKSAVADKRAKAESKGKEKNEGVRKPLINISSMFKRKK